jgi:DNA-binding transcriptional ArsR family regulator
VVSNTSGPVVHEPNLAKIAAACGYCPQVCGYEASATLICKLPLAYSAFMVDVFRALDDQTRRLVLDELSVRDGQTLFEICFTLTMRHGLGLTRQAISQHLGVLESAGLVVTERRGRSKFHYFSPEPLAEITARWPTRKRTE